MQKNQKGFSLVIVLSVIVILGIGVGGWLILKDKEDAQQPTTTQTSVPSNESSKTFDFENPKKGAHFETSTPEHGTTVAAVPVDIVLNFNFDLHEISSISITKDGKEYGAGATTVDSNKLSMRRKMGLGSPDGLYTVKYNGCWPDRSCHDGHFQFAIDSSLAKKFDDQTDDKSITVKMSDIKFKPMNLIISAGTTITWVNDDDETHYVNTDSHPAHSHHLSLNSRALTKGQSYKFTFSEKGLYPYHCSAHAATMAGSILVR